MSERTRIWWIALPHFFLVASLFGGDRHDPSPLPLLRPPGTHAEEHEGTSPFPPPRKDDTLFTVDSGGGLDTDCAYRSDGPLVIHLPVTRHVGPVNGDGTLREAADLVARGLLGAKAHLRLPAYDVDIFGDPTDPSTPAEIDRVYFNGHEIGTLTGDDGIWKLNEWVVPIEWVRFPPKGTGGAPPVAADNVIRIEIDVASGGTENWCTSVDWVELDFTAVAPILLVHGIFSNGPAAWPHFADALGAAKVPFSNSIALSPTASIDANALTLAGALKAAATAFGAKRCHIVAHSKGGLDTRAYLGKLDDPEALRVLSFYTISTPHHGAALADVGFLLAAAATVLTPAQYRILITLIRDQYGFLADLTTPSTAFFNWRYPRPPAGILFYHYGADADVNLNGRIDPEEALELGGLAPVANLVYQTVGTLSGTVEVTFGRKPVRLWGDISFNSIDIDVDFQFARNDVVVTVASAHASSGTVLADRKANHASVKSEDLARQILARILADFPNR